MSTANIFNCNNYSGYLESIEIADDAIQNVIGSSNNEITSKWV